MYERNLLPIVVSTAGADGQALIGARTSAGTVMTESESQLDVLMTRQHLKSPQSLSCTSTHPTMVTQRSWLGLGYFKIWPWKFKTKVMGIVKEKCHIIGTVSINLLPIHFTSIRPKILEIQLLQNLILKKSIGLGHWWVERSKSHSLIGIQLIHFF